MWIYIVTASRKDHIEGGYAHRNIAVFTSESAADDYVDNLHDEIPKRMKRWEELVNKEIDSGYDRGVFTSEEREEYEELYKHWAWYVDFFEEDDGFFTVETHIVQE